MRSVSCKVRKPFETTLWYLDGNLCDYKIYKYLLASVSADLLYAVDFLMDPLFRQAFRFSREDLKGEVHHHKHGIVRHLSNSDYTNKLSKLEACLIQALNEFILFGDMSEYIKALVSISEQLYTLCPHLRFLDTGLDNYLASHNLPSLKP